MTRIRVENRMFKSKEEAAKFYNLKPSTVKWRLNNGWSIEETFELVDRNTNSYPFNEKNYKSINSLYNDNGWSKRNATIFNACGRSFRT